ncbi:MAG: N-acetylmuramoyl-L-alanine amidase [Gemmatimonadetes bacterium]|nr:N-acetylmuramoyl-L-alanine amidase [Gemmatimonadota bacterium]
MRALAAPPPLLLFLSALILATAFEPVSAQSLEYLPVRIPDGGSLAIPVVRHRDYAAFPSETLAPLGWSVSPGADRTNVRLRHITGVEVALFPGSPFIRWNGELVQLVNPPYWFGETLQIPVQLLVDVFPAQLPASYRFDSDRFALEVGVSFLTPAVASSGTEGLPGPAGLEVAAPPAPGRVGVRPAEVPAAPRRSRIVVIDPGHGGSDPGAVGSGGVREKDVALAVALALARELSRDTEIEVQLTRDRDVEVPLWSRGEWATEWKGDRPGILISLHANALSDRVGVRGFETYFLSEARDENERRVAALENSPLVAAASGGPDGLGSAQDPQLGSILRDLETFDHQHWSADLARQVQEEIGRFHPGTDRGVKQGQFAVITNSLMPSVLVEIGFLTNSEEERLLTRPEFHRDAAQALARAIREFFLGYPHGQAG